MEHRFLHTFRLTVEGLPEPVDFHLFHELEEVQEVTDSFAKYVARQEDDFLPLGPSSMVRADRVIHLVHVGMKPAPTEAEP